jgi:hypothetical protein
MLEFITVFSIVLVSILGIIGILTLAVWISYEYPRLFAILVVLGLAIVLTCLYLYP